MKTFLLIDFALQNQPSMPREGMRFWVFWFLLSVILLLVFFIFLREKRLRQKLNLFLSRAKRGFIKSRLQARLRKENLKKTELIRELGEETRKQGISIEESREVDEELKKLEDNMNASQTEIKQMDSKIQMFKSQLEESSRKHEDQIRKMEAEIKPYIEKMTKAKEKEKLIELNLIKKQHEIEEGDKKLQAAAKEAKEIEANAELPEDEKRTRGEKAKEKIRNLESQKEKTQEELEQLREERPALEKEMKGLQRRINDCERTVKQIDKEKKEQTRSFHKEIKELEKSKQKVQKKIEDIVLEKEPLFESLGKIIDEVRVKHSKLAIFYSQIDRTNRNIKEIETNIQNL
jgi:chromosome segregation ATPase